jgi:hypothetical protein
LRTRPVRLRSHCANRFTGTLLCICPSVMSSGEDGK